MNNKLLSKFAIPTEEFKNFTTRHLPVLYFRVPVGKLGKTKKPCRYHLNGKRLLNFDSVDFLYKSMIAEGAEFLVSCDGGSNIYFCKRSNFKQLLFNLRNKDLKSLKVLLKKSKHSNIKVPLHNLQIYKVNFAKLFRICVFSLKENIGCNYLPFEQIKNSPKKNNLAVRLPDQYFKINKTL